jgi:peptide deformylase|tara:strand:- start:332 stop:916 length:585 start_codon:yes stop_codon:yes gene_type:complete
MQVIDCLKENNPYINQKLKEVSVDEGLSIAKDLFNVLNKRQDGIGLAANQVGIDASVAVVNVREPIILINPKIVKQWEPVPYFEGCLSFKGKSVQTQRYSNIVIKTEQEEAEWYFSGAPNPSDGKGSWEKQEQNKHDKELRLLETICVQHEIDHLNGMTISDRQIITTITNEVKVGRNDPCVCGSGKKYKKCCM